MATITRQEIIQALGRLGQLAEERGTRIELVLLGGALMVLSPTRNVNLPAMSMPSFSHQERLALCASWSALSHANRTGLMTG
jgi:hypothetical protein